MFFRPTKRFGLLLVARTRRCGGIHLGNYRIFSASSCIDPVSMSTRPMSTTSTQTDSVLHAPSGQQASDKSDSGFEPRSTKTDHIPKKPFFLPPLPPPAFDFSRFREATLRKLLSGEGDRSRAQGVDVAIRPVVDRINSHPQWCTTSSCSGRILVFHRAGGTRRRNDPAVVAHATVVNGDAADGTGVGDADAETDAMSAYNSGTATEISEQKEAKRRREKKTTTPKGRQKKGLKRGSLGRGVLFESHSPLATSATAVDAREKELESCEKGDGPGETATVRAVAQRVWEQACEIAAEYQQETAKGGENGAREEEQPVMAQSMVELLWSPLLLHVRCGDLASAAHLVHAGTAAGFRRSGMALNINKHHRAAFQKTPIVSDNSSQSSDPGNDATGAAPIPQQDHSPQCMIAGTFGFNAPLVLDGEVLVSGPQAIEALLHRSNRLFAENVRRRDLLDEGLRRYMASSGSF